MYRYLVQAVDTETKQVIASKEFVCSTAEQAKNKLHYRLVIINKMPFYTWSYRAKRIAKFDLEADIKAVQHG